MKMLSPTRSKFGATFGGRFPKQIRRSVPLYIACILVVIFLSSADTFSSSSEVSGVARRALSFHTGAVKDPKFPRKIWQMWKDDPLGFDERDLTTARTWTAKNPGHRYEVLTDNNDMYYVETKFGPAGLNRPDVVYMYRSLTARIVKADLLRYLVLYLEGGIYTDIDVEALKPMDRWIPDRYNEKDIDMVIGVEIDQPEFKDHAILGKKSQSFCQWTFMTKPGHPVMLRLINSIIAWLNDLAKKQGVPISELVLDFDEVISGTGPSAFTTAVLAEMSARKGKPVTWNTFHNMAESKLVSNILVLTVEAFAAGQGHSDSGNHNARTALVKHHYHASMWPSKHPRYSHPVYGEVEQCNWEPECVREWDANKAAFEALSPEEQALQLAFKEAQNAEKEKAPEFAPFEFKAPENPFEAQQVPLAPVAAPLDAIKAPGDAAPLPVAGPALPAPIDPQQAAVDVAVNIPPAIAPPPPPPKDASKDTLPAPAAAPDAAKDVPKAAVPAAADAPKAAGDAPKEKSKDAPPADADAAKAAGDSTKDKPKDAPPAAADAPKDKDKPKEAPAAANEAPKAGS